MGFLLEANECILQHPCYARQSFRQQWSEQQPLNLLGIGLTTPTMETLPPIETPWPLGTRLRHYKGGLYEIAGYCLIEATLETGVLYRPLGADGKPKADLLWMRPLARFGDQVETPEGVVTRFRAT
jgi:hypothetical protein